MAKSELCQVHFRVRPCEVCFPWESPANKWGDKWCDMHHLAFEGEACPDCLAGLPPESGHEIITSEVVSLQVVTFECGICQDQYRLELHNGDIKLVECPRCENKSLQMVVGTE